MPQLLLFLLKHRKYLGLTCAIAFNLCTLPLVIKFSAYLLQLLGTPNLFLQFILQSIVEFITGIIIIELVCVAHDYYQSKIQQTEEILENKIIGHKKIEEIQAENKQLQQYIGIGTTVLHNKKIHKI